MSRPIRPLLRGPALAVAGLLMLAACGSPDGPTRQVDADDWSAVLDEARGQSVDWYMYGGDDALNAFVKDEVATRLAKQGIELRQVRIDDTADAVNKVLGEKQAGRTSGGAVDAIWLNGENFATGVQADIWSCGWAESLPNARHVDLDDPAVSTDFGIPVDGCESVWQTANSALVYDSDELDRADVASIDALLAWAERDPGRFTYPAPPDFTGSMAVRSLLYGQTDGPGTLEGKFDADAYARVIEPFWDRLNDIEPTLWRSGRTYPASQDAVEKLYANGEISAFFTYGPGAVGAKVSDGVYPKSTREAVPASGNISNTSFIAIPANARHRAAALVLANTLQDPEVQLALYRAVGAYPGIDLARTSEAVQRAFAEVPRSRSTLSIEQLSADAQPELASEYITKIEKDWRRQVLQK